MGYSSAYKATYADRASSYGQDPSSQSAPLGRLASERGFTSDGALHDGDAKQAHLRHETTSGNQDPWGGRFGALLANWGLGEYCDILEQNGYDSETMRGLTAAEA